MIIKLLKYENMKIRKYLKFKFFFLNYVLTINIVNCHIFKFSISPN